MTTTELALLTGADLDRAVAKCLGYTDDEIINYGEYIRLSTNPMGSIVFCPSTDWAHGGPIIEREKIGIWWATHFVDDEGNEYGNHWYAEIGCTDANADSPYCGVATGPTPLIAAMRCFVAHKQGESK